MGLRIKYRNGFDSRPETVDSLDDDGSPRLSSAGWIIELPINYRRNFDEQLGQMSAKGHEIFITRAS